MRTAWHKNSRLVKEVYFFSVNYANNQYNIKQESVKEPKKYYFKVRAYRLVDGKKYYGKYSSIKAVKTK